MGPGPGDRGRQQALAGEQVPAEAVDDRERIAIHAVAGLELAFEVGRPRPIGRRHRDQRPARVRRHRTSPRRRDEARTIEEITDGTPRRERPRRVSRGHNLDEFLGAPRRMMTADVEQRRDDPGWGGVRTRDGATRSIDQSLGTGGRVPIDPLIGRLSTDAESARQLGDVDLVTLIIRDELHTLVHT